MVIPGWQARVADDSTANLVYVSVLKTASVSDICGDQDSDADVEKTLVSFNIPELSPSPDIVGVALGDEDVIELVRGAGSLPGEEATGARKPLKKTKATAKAGKALLLAQIFGPEAFKISSGSLTGHDAPKSVKRKAPADVAHLLS